MLQDVELTTPVEAIVSRPVIRTNCQICGEEIINEREVHRDGQVLCRTCAGDGYYRLLAPVRMDKAVPKGEVASVFQDGGA